MVAIGTGVLNWSVASLPMPGQELSGDRHLVKEFPGGILTAVVDGLGHGREAAMAAETAVATLESSPHESVVTLINRCYESLRGTRGAVMSLATFSVSDGTMTWVGVGNVKGVLLRADPKKNPRREYLFLNRGVVGGKAVTVRAFILPVRPGDMLVFATDGIHDGFEQALTASDPPPQIIKRILAQDRLGTDDALILVARYVGSVS